MTFGGFAYGSVALGGLLTTVTVACPPPSCNLIVMELLNSSPGHLNIDRLSRYIDSLVK